MPCRGDVCALFGMWKPKAPQCPELSAAVSSSCSAGAQGNWAGGSSFAVPEESQQAPPEV